MLVRISKMRFGNDGYFFGSIYGGDPLFTNGVITRGGKNLWDLTDPDGVKIIQEMDKVAKASGEVLFVMRGINLIQIFLHPNWFMCATSPVGNGLSVQVFISMPLTVQF